MCRCILIAIYISEKECESSTACWLRIFTAFVNVIEPDDAVNSVTDTFGLFHPNVLRIGNLSVAKGGIGSSITDYSAVCMPIFAFSLHFLCLSLSFVCVCVMRFHFSFGVSFFVQYFHSVKH